VVVRRSALGGSQTAECECDLGAGRPRVWRSGNRGCRSLRRSGCDSSPSSRCVAAPGCASVHFEKLGALVDITSKVLRRSISVMPSANSRSSSTDRISELSCFLAAFLLAFVAIKSRSIRSVPRWIRLTVADLRVRAPGACRWGWRPRHRRCRRRRPASLPLRSPSQKAEGAALPAGSGRADGRVLSSTTHVSRSSGSGDRQNRMTSTGASWARTEAASAVGPNCCRSSSKSFNGMSR
jgi:hypothetical protein